MQDEPTNAYDRWARYYDLGEGDRAPYLEFYRGLLTPGTRSVLEIGCGTGVIASALADELAKAHVDDPARICGVDSSGPMLDIARARDSRVEWVHADMRELPVAGRFDLVFCCFNTFQFMLGDDDLLRAFRTARDHVAVNGIFSFDLYQPNIPYLTPQRRNSLARALLYHGRQLEIREDSTYEPESRILDLDWRLVDVADGGLILAQTRFRIRQYFPEDIERLLRKSGFSIRHRYGGLDKQAFTNTSKKQVLVCAPS
jgi:SAM-dependent methyltransferase